MLSKDIFLYTYINIQLLLELIPNTKSSRTPTGHQKHPTLQHSCCTRQAHWNKLFAKRLFREDHCHYLIADTDHWVGKASMLCRVKTAYLGQIY